VLILSCKNAFAKQILENEYLNIIKQNLSKLLNVDIVLSFEIENEK
jgi:chromosomal replication initiation ATPase DnaA